MKITKSNQQKPTFDANSSKNKNIKFEVGKRLLTLRKSSGYNQQEVADAIDISRAALSYYEKGERSVDIETLYKLSSFYEVSIDYLFGLKNTKEPERDFDAVNELAELGFSYDALDNMWGNPDFVQLINDLALHKDFLTLEYLTYHSRYTIYENIDNGYRSFLTSKLLYSMIADIFENWYIDNPDRINTLSTSEKKQLLKDIELYYKNKEEMLKTFETSDYPKALSLEYDVESQLEALYKKNQKIFITILCTTKPTYNFVSGLVFIILIIVFSLLQILLG